MRVCAWCAHASHEHQGHLDSLHHVLLDARALSTPIIAVTIYREFICIQRKLATKLAQNAPDVENGQNDPFDARMCAYIDMKTACMYSWEASHERKECMYACIFVRF